MGKIEITKEIEEKCCVHRGVKGSPAPIPQEGEWTKCKEIKDISGLTHGCGPVTSLDSKSFIASALGVSHSFSIIKRINF